MQISSYFRTDMNLICNGFAINRSSLTTFAHKIAINSNIILEKLYTGLVSLNMFLIWECGSLKVATCPYIHKAA
jgi:hypothetical protein